MITEMLLYTYTHTITHAHTYKLFTVKKCIFKSALGDFPGGSVVETSSSNVEGVGSIPVQGTKIPHASQPINQKINNRNSIATNLIKTLKTVHIKKRKTVLWHDGNSV